MERQSYVSCIKINGVPILPPMMTKEVIEEANYHKQLAIAIEKKLSALHVTNRSNINSTLGKEKRKLKGTRLPGRVFSLDDAITARQIRNLDRSTSLNIDITSQVPTETLEPFDCLDKEIECFVGATKEAARWRINSDEDNGFDSETRPAASTASRSTSADLSHGLNETPSNTSDTTPETYKPQVPKTLDIVPLTLDNSTYNRSDKGLDAESGDFKETPKLVRQGSYVLDTPSPMLLAHMQLELANSGNTPDSEYVPTPTTNTVRRKEWNIAQGKVEWEHYENDKETSKHTRNNQKENRSRTIRKHVKSESFDSYTAARSVDCIQAMLVKEYIDKSRPKTSHGQRRPISCSSSFEKSQKIDRRKNYNLPKTFGGSLGNLNNVCAPISKRIEQHEETILSNGFEEEEIKRSREEIKDSTTKLKSSITTDKLLTVYKEIQRMHQKQMTELVTRQQKEQSMLQKEFEKQQLLLLTEIKKSFPKDPLSVLSNTASTADFNTTTEEETTLRHSCANVPPDESSSIIIKSPSTRSPRMDRANTVPCPLDYIYPRDDIQDADVHSITCSQFTRTLEAHPAKEAELNKRVEENPLDAENVGAVQNSEEEDECKRKRSSVSRQLFPLDSKTVHVPVLDNAVYESKHVRCQ